METTGLLYEIIIKKEQTALHISFDINDYKEALIFIEKVPKEYATLVLVIFDELMAMSGEKALPFLHRLINKHKYLKKHGN